ncbi:bile salt sulfotransferase [Lacerta agilis]|uniref:bile salt sulfotransferase n=1 Tax=Lacerta agilis TaxID=80427 RepID=UPI0014192281|nr:bile salt sulfotransferase [Lacerta agilis]
MAVQYVHYKGIKFPPGYNSVENLCFAENEFEVRDDDIFNVTYPKSGTVWMIEILSLILNGGNPTRNQSVLNSCRAPWFTTQLGLETAHLLPPPRLLTCHLPIHIFPKAFFSSKAKVVYTLRDPRDVLVSYYHFCKMCVPFENPESFNHFLESFLSGDVPFGSWFDHVTGWMKLKGKSNLIFISYEELKQDLYGIVERLCHFLGKELDEAAIMSVVENTSFEAMRRNDMCNSTMLPKEFMDQEKGTFLRKGICGDWKTHFTVAQSEYFDKVYQEKMVGLKGIFPWEHTRQENHSGKGLYF